MYKLLLISALLMFSGCAPVEPYVKPVVTIPHPGMPGTYHKVERGQTLWRISKMYDVELDEVVSINRIPDATNIEIGQSIFIPNRQKPVLNPNNIVSDDFSWPAKGRVVSAFGQTYGNMVNKGINIQPASSSNVVAAREGKISFSAQNFGAFGKTIIIDHGDGFSTVYARNAEVFVKPGDAVQKGAVIAKVGSAGRDKNTYLHFEIRKGSIPQNPYYYLPQ